MRNNRIGTKKDEATEIAPNLMFSQRNNPYCELLHISCAAKIDIFSISQGFFEKNSNFDHLL